MGKKAPSAPSPAEQATAQGKQNKETAYYNAQLQNMNQYTPYGNLTFQNLGNAQAPKWSSTTSLSPQQQQIFDSQNRQDIAMSGLGEQQIGRINDAVSTPYAYDGIQNGLPTYADINTASQSAQDAIMSRLTPQFAQQEEALRTRLINQGIGQGSQAYQKEMESFGQQQNDALMQAVITGQQYGSNAQNMALQRRGQEIGEYDAQRNAPLNEYIGLTSGTQIQNPQFGSGGNQGIQSFDIAGAMQNQYSNQQAASNNTSSALSSLFGLGGSSLATMAGATAAKSGFIGAAASALPLLFSDIRLKDNIKYVGKEKGHNMYEFSYKGSPDRFVGVMAQDILKTNPEAVGEHAGFMTVNYSKLGLEMRAL